MNTCRLCGHIASPMMVDIHQSCFWPLTWRGSCGARSCSWCPSLPDPAAADLHRASSNATSEDGMPAHCVCGLRHTDGVISMRQCLLQQTTTFQRLRGYKMNLLVPITPRQAAEIPLRSNCLALWKNLQSSVIWWAALRCLVRTPWQHFSKRRVPLLYVVVIRGQGCVPNHSVGFSRRLWFGFKYVCILLWVPLAGQAFYVN